MVQYTSMMKGFWTKGIAAATHILNCAPCKNLAWRTPYEVLFGHVPDITYLCIFSCHAWVFNNQGKKWDLKSKPMTLVGFETGSKAYCLWDLTTSSIVVSTNGCFDKNMFPHKPKPSAPEVHAQPIILSSKSPPPSYTNYISVPWFSEDEPEGTSSVHPPPPSHPTSPFHHVPQAHQMPPPASPPLDAPMSTIVEPPISIWQLLPWTPSPNSLKGKQPICRSECKVKQPACFPAAQIAEADIKPEGEVLNRAYLQSMELFVTANNLQTGPTSPQCRRVVKCHGQGSQFPQGNENVDN